MKCEILSGPLAPDLDARAHSVSIHSISNSKMMKMRKCLDWLIDRDFLAEVLSTFILIVSGVINHLFA